MLVAGREELTERDHLWFDAEQELLRDFLGQSSCVGLRRALLRRLQ